MLYALIVAGLSGILWWGHRTHWDPTHSLAAAHEDIPHLTTHNAATRVAQPADPLDMDQAILDKAGIELGRIERQTVATKISTNGVVSYDQNLRAQLSSRVPGHVWRVERRVGDIVRKGDVLAIIDAAEVGLAKGELLKALVVSEMKTAAYDRIKHLEQAISGRQIREAEVAAREARIHAQVCVQSLVNMGLPLTLNDLAQLNDDQRAKHVQFLGLPADLVATLEATTTSNLVPLIAPFDGVVIGRGLAMGEVVSPEQPQIEIADIRKVWVLLEVRKEDLNLVRIGQPLTFTPDGLAGEVSGRIDWISSEVDEKTRTLQVRAEIENPTLEGGVGDQHSTHMLRANTFGTGKICVREQAESLVAPTAAVQFNGERHMVFVRAGTRFVPRTVEVGVTSEDHTEIRSGVTAGDEVATTGSHVLKAELQLALVGD